MRINIPARILSLMLILSMLLSSAAVALTAEEALGLTSGSSVTSASGGTFYPMLQFGSRDGDDAGAYVVMLQNRLIALGYLNSSADGQYGAGTEAAVLSFQQYNDLTPTGVADSTTQSVLYSAEAVRAPEQAVTQNDTLRVQQALANWGFLTGRPDGIMGDGTRSAVAEFKEYIYRVHPELYAQHATPVPVAPENTPSPFDMPVVEDLPAGYVEIRSASGFDGEISPDLVKFADGEARFQVFQRLQQQGDEGAEVWRIQRRLNRLGYLYQPDGSYGKLTTLAIKAFQRRNGLPENGAADQATQEVLFSENAINCGEYVFPYKIVIDISDQRVYIFGWDGDGYNTQVGSCLCSTGMDGYDTPLGTYQSAGRVNAGEWYYFKDYNCYAKYAYRIVGGIMTHSVLYNAKKEGPTNSSVHALGRKASHGCIRMQEGYAKWICENCPEGTTVVIKE